MPATRLPNPNLVFIGGQGIIMDYPCAKFGDFSFSCFDFIMRTDRQTESQRSFNYYSRDYRRRE